jgi:hypothetical protein
MVDVVLCAAGRPQTHLLAAGWVALLPKQATPAAAAPAAPSRAAAQLSAHNLVAPELAAPAPAMQLTPQMVVVQPPLLLLQVMRCGSGPCTAAASGGCCGQQGNAPVAAAGSGCSP